MYKIYSRRERIVLFQLSFISLSRQRRSNPFRDGLSHITSRNPEALQYPSWQGRTGNAMGGVHWADVPDVFNQKNSCLSTGCFPRCCNQAVTTVGDGHTARTTDSAAHGEDARRTIVVGVAKKRRVPRVVGGGLRQFSIVVCKKVESKGRTSYNEVADEIIEEFSATDQYDEKNIRRRVYDAINVLMAMNIIAKENKEIRWKGFPRPSISEGKELEALRLRLLSKIEKKATYLQELQEQLAGLHNLMLRNQQLHKSGNGTKEGVSLPFILVRTRPRATVEIEISQDTRLVHFDFNGTPFSLHDDTYIIKAMRKLRDPQPEHMMIFQNPMAQTCASIDDEDQFNPLASSTPFSWHSEIPNAQQ